MEDIDVAELVLNRGTDVRALQPSNIWFKEVTLLVSNRGTVVSDVQSWNMLIMLVFPISNKGTDVRALQ